jgi:hypothetical protein
LDSGGSATLSLDEIEGARAGFEADSVGTSTGVGAAVIQDRRMRGATVQVGDIVLRNQTIVMRPYPPEIPEMDCVFGIGLLRDYIVQFDYTTPEVRFFALLGFKPSPRAVSIPFKIDRNIPIADATFTLANQDQVRGSVVLDTGAGYYSAVFSPAFDAQQHLLTRIGTFARRPDRAKGTGGEVELLAARLSSIELGAIRVNEPIVGVIRTASAGFPWDGLLGAGFFRRFVATFDYSRQQLWLEPNATIGERQPFDASGVGFRRDEQNEYVVDVLIPDSAAAADLLEGDVLVSIDDRSAGALTRKELAQILNRPAATCVLTIRRKGELTRVTLKLRERL